VADVLLVYAKTNKDKGAKGISAFIVEKDCVAGCGGDMSGARSPLA
jgi:alkylation response protein AidB-like acyl-CoA dehydrogenase